MTKNFVKQIQQYIVVIVVSSSSSVDNDYVRDLFPTVICDTELLAYFYVWWATTYEWEYRSFV